MPGTPDRKRAPGPTVEAEITLVPGWFRTYVDLETDASEIRWYQAEIVPGLLQTERYFRAMNAAAQPRASDAAVEDHVRVRMERTALIDRTDGPALNFILSESVLRSNIGGAEVMRDQLRHLAAIAERPNVELQVYPFDAETYEAATFGFNMLRPAVRRGVPGGLHRRRLPRPSRSGASVLY